MAEIEAIQKDIRDLRVNLRETDKKISAIDNALAQALIFVGQFSDFEKKMDDFMAQQIASKAESDGKQEMSRMYVAAISGIISTAITLLGIWIAWNTQG